MQVNVAGYQIKDLFEKAKQTLVILGESEDVDQAIVATGLVELFTSYGKQVTLVTKATLPEATKPLVKPEQLKSELEPKSLVLSFDWSKNQLSKVSYFLEGNRFNLIIGSKGKRLKADDIAYSYRGIDFDLILCVGIQEAAQLENLGIEEETLNSVPSINLDKSVNNQKFAKVNLVEPGTDSLAAATTNVLKEAGVKLPTRVAEIFLYGIRLATTNFTLVSDPTTFEAAAYCKRAMIPGLTVAEEGQSSKTSETKEKAPEAWLAPKVFRSGKFS